MINDAFGQHRQEVVDEGISQPLGSTEISNQGQMEGSGDFHDFLKDGSETLYEGSKYTKLEFLIKLYHIKVYCRLTDKAMTMILDLLRDAFEDAKLPPSFYEDKKIIKKLGLDYTKILACPNNCILFWEGDSEFGFPGLGILSGWNTHIGFACPTCNFDTEPCRLRHGELYNHTLSPRDAISSIILYCNGSFISSSSRGSKTRRSNALPKHVSYGEIRPPFPWRQNIYCLIFVVDKNDNDHVVEARDKLHRVSNEVSTFRFISPGASSVHSGS
ncbi:hypothetical protein MTR67_002537 [Solanum verrucosum]|uniref:Uncharacterized protein n=1 Tax=Solanum verrucosum TaxID=315347 RepID=A0AAF0PR70_SOLVR|nr:hypothetical protein MTR67_002537 [Solanum verrucosum]